MKLERYDTLGCKNIKEIDKQKLPINSAILTIRKNIFIL